MAKYRIETDKGTYEIETEDPPQPSAAARFGEGLYTTTLGGLKDTGLALLDFLRQARGGPAPIIDPTSRAGQAMIGLIHGHVDQAQKAKDALDRGDYTEAFGHTLATILPGVGPAAAHAGERMGGARPTFDKYGNVVEPGAAPDVAGGLGETTGLLGMSASGPAARSVARRLPASVQIVPPLVKSTLNPVEASAIAALQERGIPLTVGQQTGSKVLRSAENVTAHQPFGAATAGDFAKGQQAGLERVASEFANEQYPTPQRPETAGRAIVGELDRKIEDLGGQSEAGYADAWAGRGDRAYTRKVPVRVDDVVAPDGTVTRQPVYADVNMPVDVREIKAQAAPLREELSWSLAHADQSQSAAFNVLGKILAGDDFIPAPLAERGLSALKTMARTKAPGDLRTFAQGTAASLVGDLQGAIDDAVGQTGQDALRGLQKGRAMHASKMEIDELAQQLRDEPVQVFRQMTWGQDAGIDFLRRIAAEAPEQMPQIGRAYIDQLFEKATQEGGFKRAQGILREFQQLGPETKRILFPDPDVRAGLERFFKGAQMIGDPIQTSGTAPVTAAKETITSPNPLRWFAGWAGSKLLFTPGGQDILLRGLRMPLKPGAASGAASAAPPAPGGPAPVSPSPGGPPSPAGGTTPAEAQALFEQEKAGGYTPGEGAFEPGLLESAEPGTMQQTLDAAAQAALERLRKRGTFTGEKLSGGIPVDDMGDLAIYGAAKLGKGIIDLSKWSRSMLADAKAEGLAPAKLTELRKLLPAVYSEAKQYELRRND